jgi:hypothetical protein
MSDAAAEPPPTWNATERSRAQTRALLMVLSRDRRSSFESSPVAMALLSLVSIGFLPAWLLGSKCDRMTRLHQTEMAQLGDWIAKFVDAQVGRAVGAGDRTLRQPLAISRGVLVPFFTACALLAGAAWFRGEPFVARVVAWGMLFIVAQALHYDALSGWRLSQARREALAPLNKLLASRERRAVDPRPLRGSLMLALVLVWFLAICLTIVHLALGVLAVALLSGIASASLNANVRRCREVHLQLIERLLEWMDDTGLPVEYEVTALNPDEIAAMMR